MEVPIKCDTVKSGWSIVYIEGSQVMIFKKYCFFSLKIDFVSANSAFHLGLHSLQSTVKPLKNRYNKGLKDNGSSMKVESIAECSLGAFCNTFDLH